MPMTPPPELDYGDVQGLVRFGHGRLEDACYLLVDVADAAAARTWLRHAPVTTAVTMTPPPGTALQIAFTAKLTKGEIALTCDEDGCVLRVGDEVNALPTQAVKVVDTSGAGDSFNGAYLAARLKGKPPQEAVKDGLALAARVVAQPGALIPR